MGAATDSLGLYWIDGVPLGHYELVASIVGFETVAVDIDLNTDEAYTFNFELDEITYNLDDIEVTVDFDHDWWERRLRTFKRAFLSTTKNASKCEIFNPLVLGFQDDGLLLRANASDPIIVENRALGYRHTLELDFFEYNYSSEFTRYMIHDFFEEIEPENEREQQSFERKRYQAYQGSLRHFLSVLVKHRSEESAGTHRLSGYMVNALHPSRTESPQSTLLQLIIGNYSLSGNISEINLSELLTETDSGSYLLYSEDYIIVNYDGEREDTEYLRFMERDARNANRKNQITLLQIRYPVEVNARGILNDPLAVVTYGYMGWERFAELLPSDYIPPAEPPPTNRWRLFR